MGGKNTYCCRNALRGKKGESPRLVAKKKKKHLPWLREKGGGGGEGLHSRREKCQRRNLGKKKKGDLSAEGKKKKVDLVRKGGGERGPKRRTGGTRRGKKKKKKKTFLPWEMTFPLTGKKKEGGRRRLEKEKGGGGGGGGVWEKKRGGKGKGKKSLIAERRVGRCESTKEREKGGPSQKKELPLNSRKKKDLAKGKRVHGLESVVKKKGPNLSCQGGKRSVCTIEKERQARAPGWVRGEF